MIYNQPELDLYTRIIQMYCKSTKEDQGDWKACSGKSKLVEDMLNSDILQKSLETFGTNEISNGVNCADYIKIPYVSLLSHMEKHEEIYKELTRLSPDILQVSNRFDLIGKHVSPTGVIPVTAYRIGYYAYQINKLLRQDKRQVVLEIGGGYGLLADVLSRLHKNTCHIIVDLPCTAILSAFFLCNLDKRVCLYGEFDGPITSEMTDMYDVIIIPPKSIHDIQVGTVDAIINTASFPEMNSEIIRGYIQEIARIQPRCFYYDNLAIELNADALQTYCAEMLDPLYSLIFKQETPIHYNVPELWHVTNYNLAFEERVYVLNIKSCWV